jgi:hypothetical protein
MRSLWLVNLLLGVVVAILLEGVVSLVLDRPSWIFSAGTTAPHVARVRSALPVEAEAAPARPTRPSLDEFAVVTEKDLFRNPNPEPPAPPPARPVASPRPQVPLPVLVGTLFVDDDGTAILLEQNRAESYRIGDQVGGGTLSRIEADRVVIQREGTSVEVLLHAAIAGATPSRPAGPGSSPRTSPPVIGGAASSGPPAVPFSATAPDAPPAGGPAREAEAAVPTKTRPPAMSRGPLSRGERMERVRQGLELRNQLRRQQAETEGR